MPPHHLAACAGALLLATACGGGTVEKASEARHPSAPPLGSELMAQQAPPQQAPPAVNLSMTGIECPRQRYYEDYSQLHRNSGKYPFFWARAMYSGNGWRGGTWSIDYPKSDQQFLIVINRLIRLNAYDCDNVIALWDPDLFKFPLIYMLEVGGMYLTEAEVVNLRKYMEAGGFVIVDDFWGQRDWDNFLWNMRRVFPDKSIVDIGLDHPIYHSYYEIEKVEQVPAINNVVQRTECYGCYPEVRGMYDDQGRLMMMINFNTDLGDAWEWAESPAYPLDLSTYAYQMGANMIVYAMSH